MGRNMMVLLVIGSKECIQVKTSFSEEEVIAFTQKLAVFPNRGEAGFAEQLRILRESIAADYGFRGT
jgi:hypothetical protein